MEVLIQEPEFFASPALLHRGHTIRFMNYSFDKLFSDSCQDPRRMS
jgi:hypothetical protein